MTSKWKSLKSKNIKAKQVILDIKILIGYEQFSIQNENTEPLSVV